LPPQTTTQEPEAEQVSPLPHGGLPSRQQLWPTLPHGCRQRLLALHTSGDWQRGLELQQLSPAWPQGPWTTPAQVPPRQARLGPLQVFPGWQQACARLPQMGRMMGWMGVPTGRATASALV